MPAGDGAEESGRQGAEITAVEVGGQVPLDGLVADGAVCLMYGCGYGGGLLLGFLVGSELYIPKAVSWVAVARHYLETVFPDVHGIFCEDGDAVVVAKLADRYERAGLEVVGNVADLGGWGECVRQWDGDACVCLHAFSVGNPDGRASVGSLNV